MSVSSMRFACATFVLASTVAGSTGASAARGPGAPTVCPPAPAAQVVERRYIVRARIRPLLFWTSRREVGDARFLMTARDEPTRRFELLIGTDPDRAPLRLNRWGYIAETVCGTRALAVGLMTESDEQTIEEARAALPKGVPAPLFKAIRATVEAGHARTETMSLAVERAATYRDLDAVLGLLPPAGAPRTYAVPEGTALGFLPAVTSLVDDSVTAYSSGSGPPGTLRRSYVYGGRLYELTLVTTTSQDAGVLEGAFEIRNAVTGSRTEFQLTYATTGALAAVPTRVVYRPRWWLELELRLEGAER
jgi:hypothetical protein